VEESKKRKKPEIKADEPEDEPVKAKVSEDEPAKKKKKLGKKERQKLKNSQEGQAGGAAKPEVKQEKKSRYTLFVGKIPFDATKEEIDAHFRKYLKEKVIGVRLMYHKGTGESRGIAFVDVEDKEAYTIALKLHHTKIQDKAINVEPTVGGGGNSETRKQKLNEKKQTLNKKRRERVKKEGSKVPKKSKDSDSKGAKDSGAEAAKEPRDKKPEGKDAKGPGGKVAENPTAEGAKKSITKKHLVKKEASSTKPKLKKKEA